MVNSLVPDDAIWCHRTWLTHWGRYKMEAISQTTFSNTFSWMKMYEFQLKFQFIPKGTINNISAVVQIMAWRRPGDKTLSEPMMVRLPTHICVTQPQWVNTVYGNGLLPSDWPYVKHDLWCHMTPPGHNELNHCFSAYCHYIDFWPYLSFYQKFYDHMYHCQSFTQNLILIFLVGFI